jgi:O-antigen/teichoic acid export membrane protein
MVIAPHVAQAYSKGNHGRLQRLSRQSARVVFAGALPVALSLIFLGGPIIGVLFGKNYVSDVKMPLAILAGGQLLNAFFGSVGLFLMMSGHEDDTFHGQAWALVVNLSLALFLIPRFGATGAACAAAAGLIIWNLVLAVKLFRRLGIRPAVF